MKKIFHWLRRLAIAGTLIFAVAFAIVYFTIVPSLPPVDALRDVQLEVPLRIYSENNHLLGVFGERRRTPVKLADVPDEIHVPFLARNEMS